MNITIIGYIIGWILNLEAAFMLLPIVTGAIYGEKELFCFLLTAVVSGALGLFLTHKKPEDLHFHIKEGCVTVSLSWIVLSIVGAVPFVLSGAITHPIDAIFETVSGFTTTGASILSEVESLPRCILMWRSFTHWIGGMGVLVLLLSVVKMTGGSRMNLMKAESPGPSVDKLVPTVRSTARILYTIYLFLTVTEFIILLFCHMPLFDAITTTFGTAGTGGFGIKNDSIAGYSSTIQVVITIFMLLFGVNFNIYFLMLLRKWKQAFHSEEVRWYLVIVVSAIVLISWDIRGLYDSVGKLFLDASFQVASVITTTGFATTDFNQWPEVSRSILVILMFIGACAGSTGGGIKVSRIIILLKGMRKELRQYLHPRQVRKIQFEGKLVEHDIVRNVNGFLALYIIVFVCSVFLLSFNGKDLITNFTAVAATINNIGPGLELVGPSANFSVFNNLSKIVLIFDMLAGRLEIFPVVLLFMKDTWRKF